MPNRLFRRPTQGFRHDTLHTLFMATLFMGVLYMLEPALDFVFRKAFIDVQSIHVPDHQVDEDPELTVHRIIRQDYPGSFSLFFREAEHGTVACKSVFPSYFIYRKSASHVNPIHPKMSEWVASSADLEQCKSIGRYGPGRYYVEMCHRAKLFGLITLRRCVDSPIYQRKAGQ